MNEQRYVITRTDFEGAHRKNPLWIAFARDTDLHPGDSWSVSEYQAWVDRNRDRAISGNL